MKRLEVHWKDHFSESGWKTDDEVVEWVKERKSHRCITRGFLVHEDDEVLVIAGTYDGDGGYGDFQAIYKNHITKKRRG